MRPGILTCVCLLVACGGGNDNHTPIPDATVTVDSPRDAEPDAFVPPAPQVPRYVYLTTWYGITIGAITDPETGAYRVVGELDAGQAGELQLAPTGGFVVLSRHNQLWVYAVDAATGWLTVTNPNETAKPASDSSVKFSPDGAFLFVAQSNNTVRSYAFNPTTGALTQVGGAAVTAKEPDSLVVSRDGKRVYVLAGYELYVLDVASDGTLSPAAGSPVALDMTYGQPRELRIDGTGKYLVYILPTADKVAAFSIDPATLALTPTPGSPIPIAGGPTWGTFAPDGTRFYIACETGNAIREVIVSPATGALTEAQGSPFSINIAPRRIHFDRESSLVYVTLTSAPATLRMRIDPVTGYLTSHGHGRAIGNAGFGALVLGGDKPVRMRPKFVYVLDNSGGSITAFTMDPATGALTAVPDGTVTVSQPDQAVADPTGKYLYVISGASGLHTYAIGATGALTEIGTPIAIGSSPRAIEIAATGQVIEVAVGGNAQILVYQISPTGAPYATPSQMPMTPASTPVDIRFDGVNRQIWAVTADSVVTYPQGGASGYLSTGVVTSTGASTAPKLLAPSPDGKHMYVSLSNSDQLGIFTQSELGATPFSFTTIAAGPAVHGVAVEPTGRFVYATDTGAYIGTASTTIRAYSRDAATGALTPIAGTFTSLPRPYMAAADPSGTFLVVAATGTISPTTAGGISVFPIQQDGTLGAATNTTLGTYPSWVTIVGERD